MSVTSWAGASLGSATVTQSGGPAASSWSMSAWSVPIRKVPAGTNTCAIPVASVRVWPGDGATAGAVDGSGVVVSAGSGVEDAPLQPATSRVARMASAVRPDGPRRSGIG